MSQAKYLKNCIGLQSNKQNRNAPGRTSVDTGNLERAIKDLDRLAAIDAVLRRHGYTQDAWIIALRSDNSASELIKHIAAQNLLPISKEVTDGQ